MLKKVLLAAAIASSFGAAVAQQRAIVITEAPPTVREERIPEYRRGYDWAPGHWAWRNGQYVWVEGRFLRERRGMHWVGDRWVQRPNGRWELVAGHWERGHHGNRYMGARGYGDRDHDGVPNRNDRDRDGDGVPNRYDNAPNNPNRR
ncbi:hypothetical protein [Ramlibacter sp. PS4R-6]|uniref:hypothetical protein n=1 Tax=Ramlibacter sp. PS4R-6 TaxID=3133438 RepID=UPI00309D5CE4